MKHILYSTFIGSIALASAALAADRHGNDAVAAPAVSHHASRVGSTAPAIQRGAIGNGGGIGTQRYISTAPFRQRTYVTPRVNRSATVYSNTSTNTSLRERSFRATNQTHVRSNVVTTNNTRRTGGNFSNVNRNRNVRVTNNFRNGRFSGQQYAAFRNYHRQWHDRGWWRSHYNRVVFVVGGWYYWDDGYWYPAWGYDPYAYYPYDGPIYGYNDLAPDQVISSVQAQLQRDGYYQGPIDGQLGPMTRQAIAAFQADHGLAITSTVDEPTLESLGLS